MKTAKSCRESSPDGTAIAGEAYVLIWIAGQSARNLGFENGVAIAVVFIAIPPKNFTAQNFERTPPRFGKGFELEPAVAN